jgi:hypothetical protein
MSGGKPDVPEEDVAVLLDKVMRGETPLLMPPGTLAASTLVPCFAMGAGALGVGAGLTLSRDLLALYVGGGAAIGLGALAVVGHVMVLRGLLAARLWMRTYARILMGCTIAGSAISVFAGARVSWLLAAVALGSFVACDCILRSRSYLAFASFFSLKRKYRQDQVAARHHVIGGGHKPGL